tara:strand:+ start:443 stop:637 length:195 start_codon:yes stop_codon:yes gene_type:complete
LDEESEELTEMLAEIVAALDETVTERDLYKKMYQQERDAKEAMAKELESALLKISRLNFYLENT